MDSPWFSSRRPQARCELRLFCLPFAGGSAAVFDTWQSALPGWLEVVPIELPGHGRRGAEPPVRAMTALIDALAQPIRPLLDRPFAFFGHSMGAIIALELAAHTAGAYGLEAEHFFASGAPPPHVPWRVLHGLTREALIGELRRIDGLPAQALGDERTMDLFLPLLRADFELVHSRAGEAKSGVLACPVSVFGGEEDLEDVPRQALDAWRTCTRSPFFEARLFPGGHFFVHSARTEVVHEIGRRLVSWRHESRMNINTNG